MKRIFSSVPFRIFLVAFVLRLIPVIALRNIGIGLDDMFQYDMLARSLATGNGYRWYAYDDLQMLEPYVDFDLENAEYDPDHGVLTSFRAPLYPSFLALIYLIAGIGPGRFLAARLVQTLLGASLAPLTFAIARCFYPGNLQGRMHRSDRVAAISAWVVAVYPLLVLYPFGLATENLFFPLLLLSFLYLLKAAEKATPVTFILAGIFLGLTSLTRSIIIPFCGFAVLWVWFRLKERSGTILLVISILVVTLPWIARNSLLHHKLTGIESSMGYNLYVGYHPDSDGSFTYGASLDLIPILDDSERDRIGTQKALNYIREDPGRFLPLAINRLSFFLGLEKRVLVYFYANNFLGHIPPLLLLLLLFVMLTPFVLLTVSAPFGAVNLGFDSKTILLWILFLAYLLPHVFILSEDRFHLALVPFVSILAAIAWAGGWKTILTKWRISRGGQIALLSAALCVLILIVNWGWELSRDLEKLMWLFGSDGNVLYLPY